MYEGTSFYKVSTKSEATLCKAHNNANVIAISEEMDRDLMKEVIKNYFKRVS